MRLPLLIAGMFTVVLALSLPMPAGPPSLQSCASKVGKKRSACFERLLDSTPPVDWSRLDLEPLFQEQADAALEFSSSLQSRLGDSAPASIRAFAAAARGRALARLDRKGEAADALRLAAELDDGGRKLAWFSTGSKPVWTANLDMGPVALEAVQALIVAGRKADARTVLLDLARRGDHEQLERLWAGAADPAVENTETWPLETTSLRAPSWYPSLPDLDIALYSDQTFALLPRSGRVLVLDFWASWCEPCAEELPLLQALYEREQSRGLEILTVNSGEPRSLALGFLNALGVSLPVGFYDQAMKQGFDVRSLPTVIVADGRGRIRGRWNGYREGLEDEIADLVQRLLDPEILDGAPVAQVVHGAGKLEVAWVRQFVSVGGVLVVPSVQSEEGPVTPRLLVSAGNELVELDAEGEIGRRIHGDSAIGQLREGDLDGDGNAEWYGFRRGGSKLVVLNPREGTFEIWNAPTPVLDVLPVNAGNTEQGQLLLAGLDGLLRGSGSRWKRLGGLGQVSSLTRLDELTVLAAHDSREIVRLDTRGAVYSRRPAPFDGWTLSPETRGGFGLGTAGVQRPVVGRFFPGAGMQVAVATASGQLVLLEQRDGSERFRARWPGIKSLAAADFDGDGRDELVVVGGKKVFLVHVNSTLAEEPAQSAL